MNPIWVARIAVTIAWTLVSVCRSRMCNSMGCRRLYPRKRHMRRRVARLPRNGHRPPPSCAIRRLDQRSGARCRGRRPGCGAPGSARGLRGRVWRRRGEGRDPRAANHRCSGCIRAGVPYWIANSFAPFVTASHAADGAQ